MPTMPLSASSHWLLPLPATRKLPRGERHIYISLTLPRLSDSSLLLAPAGTLKWTVFRLEAGRGRRGASERGTKEHSQYDR